MAVANSYVTYQQLKDFFNGAPIERLQTQASMETILDMLGREVERISGMAWRAVTVTDELHTLSRNVSNGPYFNIFATHLKHQHVRSIDEFKVFDGNEYVDWIADASKEEGRNKDYFSDLENGIVYTVGYRWIWRGLDVKCTYTHGKTEVEFDAYDLNLRYAARHLMAMPRFMKVIPEAKTGKHKNAKDENNERIREIESRMADTFGLITAGDWI